MPFLAVFLIILQISIVLNIEVFTPLNRPCPQPLRPTGVFTKIIQERPSFEVFLEVHSCYALESGRELLFRLVDTIIDGKHFNLKAFDRYSLWNLNHECSVALYHFTEEEEQVENCRNYFWRFKDTTIYLCDPLLLNCKAFTWNCKKLPRNEYEGLISKYISEMFSPSNSTNTESEFILRNHMMEKKFPKLVEKIRGKKEESSNLWIYIVVCVWMLLFVVFLVFK